MTDRGRKLSIASLIVALAIAAVGVGVLLTGGGSGPRSNAWRPSLDRRDFSLTDTNGDRVTLATFRGKWLVMFFGYTSCPDVCPTTLVNLADTRAALGDTAKNTQVIFVTVDPERDTPDVMKSYLANFGADFVGLTGTAQEIAAIAKAYGVYYQKRPTEDGGYFMDHSSAVLLISPQGGFVRVYAPDAEPTAFAATLLTDMRTAQETQK